MGWIRISDDFYDNEKLIDVGPLGMAMWFAAIGFCNRNLTDGYIRKSKAKSLLDFDGIGIQTGGNGLCGVGVDGDDAIRMVIDHIVTIGLWHGQGHDCDECHARTDGGEPIRSEYLIHDYLKFQPSKAEVEEKAEANRKRVEAWREARKAERANAGNDVRNALQDEHVTPYVRDEYAESTNPPNPTPNPTPSSFSLVTSSGEGYVSNARASENPRPICPKHEENYEDGPCKPCERRRKWDEANADRLARDELERQRAKRATATQVLKDCPLCDDAGWTLGTDGTPIEPAVKCKAHLTEAANHA